MQYFYRLTSKTVFCLFLLSLLLMPSANKAGDAPLTVFKDCEACPVMVTLPLGSFYMGAKEGEFTARMVRTREATTATKNLTPQTLSWERPRHKVTINQKIAIGKFEVTFGEWAACVEDGGCDGYLPSRRVFGNPDFFKNDIKLASDDHPVFRVKYAQIERYLEWLNTKTSDGLYRLPTEAEWEYAARAGTETPYYQGYKITTNQANFSREATQVLDFGDRPELVDRKRVVKVHELDAENPWGLWHMSGNIGEITKSCFTWEHLGLATSMEYLIASDKDCDLRAEKGGHYLSAYQSIRPASRIFQKEKYASSFTGFRVVKVLEN